MPQCPTCGRELLVAENATTFCPECRLPERQPNRASPGVGEYLHRFPATSLLIAANILVFLSMVLAHVSPTNPTSDQLIRWGADSGADVLIGNQWWRIITGAFVHIGIVHLALNMWALWVLGTLAEVVLGTYLYVGIYIVSAVAGSLVSLYFHPNVVGAGASGAIIGILGAVVSVLKFARLPLPPEVIKSTLRSLIQGAVLTLAVGLWGPIDNAAHIGGLVCGLFIGLLLSWTRRADYGLQRPLRQICLLAPFALMVPLAFAVQRHGEPMIQFRRALDSIEAGRYAEAEHEARSALKRYPNDEGVLSTLSTALVYQNRDQEASKYLNQILTQDPRNDFALNNLALLDLRSGNASAVRDLLTSGLAAQPKNALGRVYLAEALESLGQDDQAIANLRSAVALDPKLYDAQYELASLYERHRRVKEAILFYKQAVQLHPGDAAPLRALVRAYSTAGMTAEANAAQAQLQQLQKQEKEQPPGETGAQRKPGEGA
jgi:rhomboid protease GluP